MEVKKLIRKNILELKAYTSARETNSQGILLDANESAIASETVITGRLNRYPDPNQIETRKLLGEKLGVDFQNIMLGTGSDEILDLLVRIFCIPGKDNVIINEPTYGMYKVICNINNIEIQSVNLTNEFQLDLEKIQEKINSNTKIVFICSPNNPTANLINKKDILLLAERSNCIIIVDEAYIEFCENDSLINETANYKNLIITRTFSKAWGLAGVRCGYCVADKEIIEILMKVKAPYNFSSLTSMVVNNILEKGESKIKSLRLIDKEKQRLINFFKTCRCVVEIFDSVTNFILIRFSNAKDLKNYLDQKGIIVRDRSSQINLENCLRITIGNEEENDLLIKAMETYEKFISQ